MQFINKISWLFLIMSIGTLSAGSANAIPIPFTDSDSHIKGHSYVMGARYTMNPGMAFPDTLFAKFTLNTERNGKFAISDSLLNNNPGGIMPFYEPPGIFAGQASAVPEPTSLALIGAGLVSSGILPLIGFARRKVHS